MECIRQNQVHRERIPVQDNWWAIRSAAVLRKVTIKGPIGVNRLAQEFGGPKDRGVKPNAAASGSRKIIRTILQQRNPRAYWRQENLLVGMSTWER